VSLAGGSVVTLPMYLTTFEHKAAQFTIVPFCNFNPSKTFSSIFPSVIDNSSWIRAADVVNLFPFSVAESEFKSRHVSSTILSSQRAAPLNVSDCKAVMACIAPIATSASAMLTAGHPKRARAKMA